jgi:glyoxylase-like metal-dependent hydrolase (beta-lactamase superfamily II)
MIAKKMLPSVYQLDTVAYSYLLADDALMVDAATPLNPTRILRGLDEVGYRPTDVKEIVATHCHRDHTGGLAALKERTGARVVVSAVEVPNVEGRALLPHRGPMTRLLRRFFRSAPVTVDRPVHEGDRVGSFEVLETPGHTPGHIVLWDQHRSLIIAGDAVFVTGSYAGPSQARYNCDHAGAIESFRRVAGMEFENLLVGHGESLLGGASRVLRERGTEFISSGTR